MDCPITAASVNIPRSPSFLFTLKNKISNVLIDLLEVVAKSLLFRHGAVMGGARDPGLLLGHLLDHTIFSILCESKLDFLQVVFASETAFIKGFIVVWSKFCGISPLDRINKVSLACIFVKRICLRLVELRNED